MLSDRLAVYYWTLCAALLAQAAPLYVHADVFHYRDGRVIAGTVVNVETETINQAPVKVWAVEVENGVFIRVMESELSLNGYIPMSEPRKQYALNVGEVEQTVATHAALAGECARLGLPDLAQAHFLRILDLDPQNAAARTATGYKRDANQRWVKEEVVMGGNRGKVLYKGRWKFPEVIAVEQQREEAKAKVLAASRDLSRWHSIALTGHGPRLQEAMQNIAQINDPLTAGTIMDFLADKRHNLSVELRLLYIDVLSRFEQPAVAQFLARTSMSDPSDVVRNRCLSALSNYGREAAIPIYMGYLKSKNNSQINSAAFGLRQLQAEGIFFPLLAALTSKHLQAPSSSGINASPTSGSFTTGGGKPVQVEVQNPEVLSALTALTGQNKGFDRAAWTAWYASVHAQPAGDLRRDP